MADILEDLEEELADHGEYVSNVSALANWWKSQGLITGAEQGAIVSAAAQANVPSGGAE